MEGLVEFYDPHPGEGGAVKPLPERIRIVANWLDGKQMQFDEAMNELHRAAIEMGLEVFDFSARDGAIMFTTGSLAMNEFPVHCWILIRFREVKST